MSKSIKIAIRTLALVGSMLSGLMSAEANPEVYNRLLDSTVRIINSEEGTGGSGVVVDAAKRLVVTNYHVAGKASTVKVFFSAYNKQGELETNPSAYYSQFDELRYDRIAAVGKVIGTWKKRDLALIQLDTLPEDVEGVKLSDTSIKPGNTIHSIGNPDASNALWVYSPGTVRQVYHTNWSYEDGQKVVTHAVETTSPVNPGDSGGPMVNNKGELIGIVAMFTSRGRLFSYAIDVREVRSLITWHSKNAQAANSPQLAQW